MVLPTPTATATKMQRDGRLILTLMKLISKVRLPESVDLDPDRPTIAAGNHQSLLDIFASAAYCYNVGTSARLVVQAKYFEQRLVGRWLRRIGCIPLNADNKEHAFAEIEAALGRHELVGMMPEGRLTKPEDRDPQVGTARPGVAELAAASNAVVRPIVFHRTGEAWPRAKWPRVRLKRPVVTVELGPPVDMPHDDIQKNTDLVMVALTDMLNELDAISPG